MDIVFFTASGPAWRESDETVKDSIYLCVSQNHAHSALIMFSMLDSAHLFGLHRTPPRPERITGPDILFELVRVLERFRLGPRLRFSAPVFQWPLETITDKMALGSSSHSDGKSSSDGRLRRLGNHRRDCRRWGGDPDMTTACSKNSLLSGIQAGNDAVEAVAQNKVWEVCDRDDGPLTVLRGFVTFPIGRHKVSFKLSYRSILTFYSILCFVLICPGGLSPRPTL
jgi:hypothetical protein